MQLPFLKEFKRPRLPRPPMEEKSYGLDPQEELEDYCVSELFDCIANRDIETFRKAIEVLVRSCFDMEEPHATQGIKLEESI
jgi:hypothetical protein